MLPYLPVPDLRNTEYCILPSEFRLTKRHPLPAPPASISDFRVNGVLDQVEVCHAISLILHCSAGDIQHWVAKQWPSWDQNKNGLSRFCRALFQIERSAQP